ncbi:hypothetical protein HDU93_008492 [Gonapodya sp. JEL0774]|nr:hypothetical protein HDU93_008492 [Gonapodya sp. JEL0774]
MLFLGLAPNPVVNPLLPPAFRDNDKLLHATAFAVLTADIVWCWSWRERYGHVSRGNLPNEELLDIETGLVTESDSPSAPEANVEVDNVDADRIALLSSLKDHVDTRSLAESYRIRIAAIAQDSYTRRALTIRLGINAVIMLGAAIVSEVVQHIAAPTLIQPIDMVKVRIQLAGEGKASAGSANPLVLLRTIVREVLWLEEGALALYQGLGAAYLRQLTYSTARMGIFSSTLEYLKQWRERQGSAVTFADRAGAGLLAGALGSLIGVPADLALVRMQADTTLPPELRRNYTGVFNALARTIREEGLRGLPAVIRAMALNVGQLTGNSEALSRLESYFGKGSSTAVYGAAGISGFLAAFLSLPFDFVKTRLQKQKADPVTGQLKYKGFLDCTAKVMREEGFVFYRGFGTYALRIAPHVTLTMS